MKLLQARLPALALALAVVSGCAGPKVAKDNPPATGSPAVVEMPTPSPSAAPSAAPQVMGPPEAFGPPMPAFPVAAATPGSAPSPGPSAAPSPAYGPDVAENRPLVLVFGPGMARAFAYAGVLRALSDNHVPVGAILATEVGSLVGAIYAKDGKINGLDWALPRFKDDAFLPARGLFSKITGGRNDGTKLVQGLERTFATRDLAQSKIPFRTALVVAGSRRAVTVQSGPAVEILRASVAAPESFTPGEINGQAAVAASAVHPFLVAEAKALGIGPVIVFDAMDPNDARVAGAIDELKGADLVIRPDLHDIGKMDFPKRTEAALRGKQAVQDHLSELKQWAGAKAAPDTQGAKAPDSQGERAKQ